MDKREQIITAAMQLLVEKGTQATPMSAIATAAGTGMGTIYNYFATKEELINAIYVHIKQEEIKMMTNAVDAPNIKSQFNHYYTAIIEYYLNKPECFAFMDQFMGSPIITDDSKTAGRDAFEPVLSLIAKGQQEGIFKQIDKAAILQFLGGTITYYVRWCLSAEKVNYENSIQSQLKMTWDAIKE